MKRWPTKPLGELAGGGQYGLNAAAMSEGTGVRFIRITDITPDGELRHEAPAFVPKDTPELGGYELKEGDVLIARSGATAGKSYIHHSFGERAVFAGYLIRFQPDTAKVPPRFIGAFLQTPAYWQQLNSHKRAVAQPNVNAKQLASLALPVPPLAEQERIVKLLDEADELRKLRTQADRRTAALIPALFHEMFGDPETNPKGWPVRRLRELADKFSDGPFGSNLKSSHYTTEGVRVIRLQNVGVGYMTDDNQAYVSPEHFEKLRKHECRPGDVIAGTLGDPNLRAFILPPEIPKALNKSDCVQIRPNPHVSVAEFVCWLLNLSSTLTMATALIQGQTRARISMGRLAELVVPVPPLALQKEFAARVTEIRAVQAEQAASRLRLENLFQSMLHRAFNGEL